MISEERIGTLLAAAAADFTPPEDGPARVLAAAAPAAQHRRRPSRRGLVFAAAAAVVVVAAGLAVVDLGSDVATDTQAGGPAARAGGKQDEKAGGSAPSVSSQAAGTTATDSADTAGAAPAVAQVDLAKVIKTGSVVLEIDEGRLDDAVNSITALAAGAGGYVSDTNTATSSEGHQTGAMTIRIPADRFEPVLEDVSRLGKLQQKEVAGRDVTEEYTDIEARLRVLTTSRESLLQVLSEARAVGDILAVQDRLNAVQTEIEQLEGRKRVLDDQVAFATLAVSVNEPGQSELLRADGDKSVWRQAIDGFTGTWGAVVAKSGTAAALVLLGTGLLALVVVAARSGRRVYARLVA